MIDNENNIPPLSPSISGMSIPSPVVGTSSAASTTTAVRKYRLGVCAMDKKARSAPMTAILSQLLPEEFETIVFGDSCIVNNPIELWPVVDALIAFYSTGFPLDKAEAYIEYHQTQNNRTIVLVNDLPKQRLLMDRTLVYKTLNDNQIPIPHHVVVNHASMSVTVFDEYIMIDSGDSSPPIRFEKPFVEKPIDGDDHNIYIYYPSSAGGGVKRLFRKIGNRSSEFFPGTCQSVRTDGTYIYEEFLSTQGTDVKVYTIGPNYAHAEARKSPVLDGKVLRDASGKEIRFPVILSAHEKEIARKIVKAFEQTICGFDILRYGNSSSNVASRNSTFVVCDVNGWSFVKNSQKYYDDCAMLLRKYLLLSLNANESGVGVVRKVRSMSLDLDNIIEDELEVATSTVPEHDAETSAEASAAEEELRCVIAVIRHGDRTPKEKMKMIVCHPLFVEFYSSRIKSTSKQNSELKIKAVVDLQALLNIAKTLLKLYRESDAEFLEFLKSKGDSDVAQQYIKKVEIIQNVLERWQLCGINRKVQLKPKKNGVFQLILKWGGDLTSSGISQAEDLGKRFRHCMYPGGNEGLLRLHSTYRHDLKIYTSDEGRVQKTAAAFAKGFLELEGDLIPILVSLVLKGRDANSMLDQSGTSAHETILTVKARLHDLLHKGDDVNVLRNCKSTQEDMMLRSLAICVLDDKVRHPMNCMERVQVLLASLVANLIDGQKSQDNCDEGKEDISEIAERWKKLARDFYSPKTGTYDLSKIPDIYDCIRYDVLHNRKALQDYASMMDELLQHSRALADALVPQEYGMTIEEKVDIGIDMCKNLLVKIRDDLDIARGIPCRSLVQTDANVSKPPSSAESNPSYRLHPTFAKESTVKSAHRSVRTRLYFTSESHIHTLLNVLRFFPDHKNAAGIITSQAEGWIANIPELGYMTHIVFRIFEKKHKDFEKRFRAEVLLSPGVTGDPKTSNDTPLEVDHCRLVSDTELSCDELEKFMSCAIEMQSSN